MTQAEIDLPDGIYPRTPWGKYWNRLPRKGAQSLSGDLLVDMLRRLAREQDKQIKITVGEVPSNQKPGWAKRAAIFVVLAIVSLFSIGFLIALVRG